MLIKIGMFLNYILRYISGRGVTTHVTIYSTVPKVSQLFKNPIDLRVCINAQEN